MRDTRAFASGRASSSSRSATRSILAKELAPLDPLSGGRVIAGVGIGWNEREYANLAAADRFHVRGAYLDETTPAVAPPVVGGDRAIPRSLPPIEDFVFGPLPVQAPLPIVIGGRAEPALRRVGALGDGYHSSSTGPAAYAKRLESSGPLQSAAGRPMPALSARVRVEFDGPADSSYAMRGSPDEMAAEVRAFEAIGVEHLALAFQATDPDEVVRRAESFDREVVPLV